MMREFRIKAWKSVPWQNRIELHGMEETDTGEVSVAQYLEMEKAEQGHEYPPFVTLSYEAAQILIDSLWDCGLRPSEGTGSAGALAATQKHLEDMRSLVFNKR